MTFVFNGIRYRLGSAHKVITVALRRGLLAHQGSARGCQRQIQVYVNTDSGTLYAGMVPLDEQFETGYSMHIHI